MPMRGWVLPMPFDAGKFQQGLWERFIERDGMFLPTSKCKSTTASRTTC